MPLNTIEESPLSATLAPSLPSDNPPYPITFEEIAEMIATGKSIPGIREISNELNTEKPTEPRIAKVEGAGRKPWEGEQQQSNILEDILHERVSSEAV